MSSPILNPNEDNTSILLLANEMKHQTEAIDRLVLELRQHREAVDKRGDAQDVKIADHEKRLHTIETTAKTGASWADWLWRLGPVLMAGALWVFTLNNNVNEANAARKAAANPPAVIQQIVPAPGPTIPR